MYKKNVLPALARTPNHKGCTTYTALTARVCDRKGKMKSNAVYKTTSEYSENSTVHGVQYIFEKVQRLMLSYLKNLMFVPILETSNM